MGDFAGLIARYGLTAVFLFTFLENIGLPIPAFPVLMLAGAYASTRHAALLMVLVAAVGGALLGMRSGTRSDDGRGKGAYAPLPGIVQSRRLPGAGRRRISPPDGGDDPLREVPSGREHDRAAAGGGLRGADIRFPAAGLAGALLWAGAAVALDSPSGSGSPRRRAACRG